MPFAARVRVQGSSTVTAMPGRAELRIEVSEPAADAGGEPPAAGHTGEVPVDTTVIATFAVETGHP